MNQQEASKAESNGESSVRDLFALSDEQILEIAPEADALADPGPVAGSGPSAHQPKINSQPAHTADQSSPAAPSTSSTSHESPVTSHDSTEPPPWLAAQMKDPWGGEEAREFWDGVQQARSEAAAYRAAFASPEDARALKELHPGGVNEARATVASPSARRHRSRIFRRGREFAAAAHRLAH